MKELKRFIWCGIILVLFLTPIFYYLVYVKQVDYSGHIDKFLPIANIGLPISLFLLLIVGLVWKEGFREKKGKKILLFITALIIIIFCILNFVKCYNDVSFPPKSYWCQNTWLP